MVRKAFGIFLGLTAFLACPCHLPLTLPLLLALLAGTPLAGAFEANLGLVVLGALIYFVFGLMVAVRLLSEKPRPAAGTPGSKGEVARGAGRRA